MGKSKVEPLVAFIRGCVEIMCPLLLRHGIPLSIPRSIAQDIVALGEQIQPEISDAKRDKRSISTEIARFVVITIDIRSDDTRSLDKHVVESGRDGACANGVAVPGIPTDLDRVG